MSPGAIGASAPTRIDLAGGTLDLWPLSVIIPRAVTINVALELRASVRITPRRDRCVVVVSRDRGKRATRRIPLGPETAGGPLSLLLRLIATFAPRRGLQLTARAEAPAGSGLGGSSALAIAAAGALDRYCAARLGRARLLRRVLNVETAELGVPAGDQDHLAAWHGGLAAYHHTWDGTRRERLPIPRDLERRLVVAHTGQSRHSGFSNWEMYRRYVDGEKKTVRSMEAIAGIAREMLDALRAGELDAAGHLLGEEGRLRERLAPSVSTPELASVGRAARAAGALGVKICGAGGGGCLAALSPMGRVGEVAQAMASAGGRVLPTRLARRGLKLEVES